MACRATRGGTGALSRQGGARPGKILQCGVREEGRAGSAGRGLARLVHLGRHCAWSLGPGAGMAGAEGEWPNQGAKA